MTDKLCAPANVSRREFAQSLAESGLLAAADLLPDAGPPDGAAAAAELVAAGKLTGYQADAVLGRRFGDLRVGNYEILDRLGAGGMGTVFKARHRRMKRIVALKVLSREVAGSATFVGRFQREVETIARLTHPNIVMAFDADEGEAGPFLVMEFVDGRDLASEVEKGGPLSPAEAVDRVLQAARGLEYAHARGIVHRDIKPGNLLRDAGGVVKVADLGLARLSDPGAGGNTSVTQAGTVLGTVDYMPPEQGAGEPVDHRADVYSLGCTLHFLLTGRPPYQGATILVVLVRHRDAPIPSLSAVHPGVPPDLDTVFRRMVAKRPEDRQQTMAEVVADLERVLAGLPPTAAAAVRLPPAPPVGDPSQTVDLGASPAGAGADTAGFELSPPPAGGSRIARLTVVVAEASRTQAGIIRGYLQKLGVAAAHTTASGREAVEMVKRVAAGVVISSLHLSDMTGVQLAAALRADPTCANVGFILATSGSEPDLAAGLPPDPSIVVMPKPFDPDRLARAIDRAAG